MPSHVTGAPGRDAAVGRTAPATPPRLAHAPRRKSRSRRATPMKLHPAVFHVMPSHVAGAPGRDAAVDRTARRRRRAMARSRERAPTAVMFPTCKYLRNPTRRGSM